MSQTLLVQDEDLVLTPYQSLFYLEWLQDPNRSDYNIIMDSTVSGDIDFNRFNKALARLVNENLIFAHNVVNIGGKLTWKHRIQESKVVSYYPRELSDSELYRIISRPFDLENDLLIKPILVRISDHQYRILFVFPHISIDGISTDEMYVEWANYYNDENYSRPLKMEEQYNYQRYLYKFYKNLLNENESKIDQFWKKRLENVTGIDLDFLKRTTTPPPREFRYVSEQKFSFEPDVFSEVKKLKSYRLTPYLFGQLVLAILMHKVSGNPDIGINYPIAMMEGKELPYGAHVNTLIIDYRFKADTSLNDLITNILSFFNEQKSSKAKYLPINEISNYAADKSVLDVGFAQTFLRDHPILLEGVTLEKVNHQFHIDLVNKLLFEQEQYDNHLNYRVRYDDHVLDSELIGGFISMYIKLFHEVLADLNNGLADKEVENYELLAQEDRNKIVHDWNNTHISYPKDETLPGLFEKQVQRYSNRPAFVFYDKSYTYKELNAKSNQVAHYLISECNVKSEEKIILILERTEWMILSILGVLKSGAAYIPIDPSIPEERLKYILDNTEAKFIITNSSLSDKLIDYHVECPVLKIEEVDLDSRLLTNPKTELKSNNLAYIIFTSGTTGNPKGVMIEHSSAVNLALSQGKLFGLAPSDDVKNGLWFANYTFDAHVSEVFTALGNGHSLFFINGAERTDILALQAYIQKYSVDVATLPPVLLSKETFLPLKTLVVAGDVTNAEVMRLYSDNNVTLINAYGPTEATVCATLHYYKEGDLNTNIGGSIGNAKTYVLDSDLKILPIGMIGELYIGGVGVARGYCNNTELTSKSFLKNPYQSEFDILNNENARIYKTGDLVRLLPDGNIEYIGRNDHQVKIRGYRIELGEIENRLIEVAGISKVAVIARSNASGNKYIAAYYVSDQELDRAMLEKHLAQYLPDYMLPATYTHMDAFPSTTNGKLDVRRLPAPDFTSTESYVAPRTDLEIRVCQIFADVLGLDVSKVGIDDDFLHLGGDSISSIQLINKLRQFFDIRISVKDIFKYKTVKSLSSFIEDENKKGKKQIRTEQGVLKDSLNFLPIQKWFFDSIDENIFVDYNQWNQSFVLNVPQLDKDILNKSLNLLQEYHDAFHLAYSKSEEQNSFYTQYYQHPQKTIEVEYLDASSINSESLDKIFDEWQKGFDIFGGKLFHIGYIDGFSDGRAKIHFAFHHLVVDAVSWRIIKNDLERIYLYLEENKTSISEPIDSKEILGEKGSSYRQWASDIFDYNESREQAHWLQIIDKVSPYNNTLNERRGTIWNQSQSNIGENIVSNLVGDINSVYNTQVNDLLLASLSSSLREFTGADVNYVTLEGHGREEIFSDLDINNTMGWFTTMYPIQLQSSDRLEKTLVYTKDEYRKIPYSGISYGALMGYNNAELPRIGFNYLGQFDSPSQIGDRVWEFSEGYVGQTISPLNKDKNLISINCAIVNGSLQIYLGGYISNEALSAFEKSFTSNLEKLINILESKKRKYLTLSDVNFIADERVINNIQEKEEVDGIFLANSLQQGFVVHALSQGDVDEAYRTQLVWEYSCPIDQNKLKEAWTYAQIKYPTLRLRFSWDEKILQIIDKKCSVDWRYLDVTHQNADSQKTFIEDLLSSDKSENYDLAKSGLFRLYLIKESDSKYTCIFNNHHAIMDGWSNPTLLMYVHDCYLKLLRGENIDCTVDSAYMDAQAYLQGNNEDGIAFWDRYINQFDIAEDLSSLLKANKRHIILSEYKHIQSPQVTEKKIDGDLFKALKEFCRSNNITLNALLQYGWHKQLSLYGASDVTVTGMTVSGRNIPIEGIEESVGLYINTLPIALQHGHVNVLDSIKELQGYINDINSHSEVNLAKIQKGGDRLFNTLFVFENYPLPKDSNSGDELSVQFKEIIEKQDYSLVLTAYEEDASATVKLQYASELFDESMIQQMLSGIVLSISQLAQNPDLKAKDVRYLNDQEYNEIVNIFNSDRVENIPNITIHSMVEKQAELYPNNIAVDYEGNLLSYKELNEKANRLAEYLKDTYGIEPDDFIGLVLERSETLIVSILAVLKAGAAYVPMDPKAPEDRLTFMVQDSVPKVILTNQTSKERLEQELPESTILVIDDLILTSELESKYTGENVKTNVEPENLAYLIYTSGTTGMPKGVMVEHRNALNLFGATDKLYHFNSNDVWTLFHSYTFDFSVWELWGAFFYGGKLLIPTYEQTRDMNMFYDLCSTKKVTVLNQTPNAFYQFTDVAIGREDRLTNLRYVVFGGEALNLEQLQPWYNIYADNAPYLINMYGITETTVHVTYKKLHRNELDKGSLIGKPLPNYSIYLLDKEMQPLPIGAVGEMYVGGEGVARGYLNREELTAERFLPNPFQTEEEKKRGINSRLYKSGDIARFLPTGELEYIGRNDFQVKIRGFRIELGEIESRLSSHEAVRQSIVLVKEHVSGAKYLAGYYVADNAIDSDSLVEFMKAYVPDYMVPSVFVHLTHFPLTVNGKLDRKALPEPTFSGGGTEKVAPRNETEEQICSIYSEVLGVKEIGIEDDFFKLGGDSISSIQLIGRLRQKLGLEIKVKDIFTFRTVKDLYTNVIQNSDAVSNRLPAEQGILSGDVALLPIQEWFFDNAIKGIYSKYNYWNQTFLIKVPNLDRNILKISLNKLFNYHDSFNLRYKQEGEKFVQYYYPENIEVELDSVDVRDLSSADELDSIMTNWQNKFDIFNGKLFHIGYISGSEDGYDRIHFAFHHLIIDMVSWRIIKNDLQSIYEYIVNHPEIVPETIDTSKILGSKSNSYRQWTNAVHTYSSRPEYANEKNYWNEAIKDITEFNSNLRSKDNGIKSEANFTVNEALSQKLLRDIHHVYGTDLNDILLSALSASMKNLTGLSSNYVLLEGHGREAVFPELDVSSTIGWFTSLYPLKLSCEAENNIDNVIVSVKDELRQLPNNGIGYGASLGYTEHELPLITFNYLGQFDGNNDNSGEWSFVNEKIGQPVASENKETAVLSVTAAIVSGVLNVFVAGCLPESEIAVFANVYKAKLEEIVNHLGGKKRSYITPSDIDNIISDKWLAQIQKDQEIEAVYKANSLQQGFIYHALNLGDVDDSYRTQLIWDYCSPIDQGKLKQAWAYAQEKYPTLRLRFGWEEELIQIVDKHSSVEWEFIDISEMSAKEQDEYTQELIIKDRNLGYDLSKSALFRIYLVKKSEDNYTCLLNNHHAILDGWSNPILLGYVHETYLQLVGGKPITISKDNSYLKAQDYLQKNLDLNKEFWSKYVDQIENNDDLSALLKADKKQLNLSEYKLIKDIQQETLIFDEKLCKQLKAYCASLGVTLNALLQYLWHKQLSIYESSDTTVVGMTLAGRNIPVDGIEESVGLYINTLPLIVNHKSQKISEALLDIQQNINDINERSSVDLAKLQKQGVRLFNTLFIFENYPSPEEQGENSDLVFKFREVIEKQDYPLTVTAFEQNQEVVFKLQYAGELFDVETINNLLSRISRIANQIVENTELAVQDLTYLSENEYDTVINKWNETRISYPTDKTFDALFEKQVALTPNNVAVVYKNNKLTYKELNDLANRLAVYLKEELNVQVGDMVALYQDRSENIILSILAIMKVGAAYVPMDTKAPIDRIEYILEDIQAKAIITDKKNKPRLENLATDTPRFKIDRPSLWTDIKEACGNKELSHVDKASTNMIYTLFTSGTTGKPKGVMIEHHSYVNLLCNYKEKHFSDRESVNTFSTTNYVFDIWGLEYGLPLLTGGTVELSNTEFKDLDASKYDFIQMTPSVLSVKHEDIIFNNPDLRILVGGEALSESLLNDLLAKELKYVLNVYGPTETTIWSTDKINNLSEHSLSIGKPISNTSVYVLDKYLKPVPVGVIGELYIGGDGVGRGYLHNAELTNERFITNPFQTETEKLEGYNSTIYQTGDLVRYLPNGNIEYIGRNDFQVKIRGHRIELGEIEACLLSHEDIRQVAIIVKENPSNKNQKYLVGYYVSDVEINSDELKTYLMGLLPDYMVPSAYVHMDKFPVNASGKLNRKALPEPNISISKSYAKPETELEMCLCQFYADTLSLKVEDISIDEDFFSLGGDSILSIKLAGRINRELNKNIHISDVFTYRNVRKLAKYLDRDIDTYISIDPISVENPTQQLLSYAQERLWFIDSFEEGTSTYNMPMTFKLNSSTDVVSLLKSVQDVVSRHEVLRSLIKENSDGVGYQEVQNKPLAITETSISSLEELNEFFKKDVEYTFKLNAEYPIRVRVYKFGDEYYMSIVVHHIAFDGWSVDVFIYEVNQLYQYHLLQKNGNVKEADQYELKPLSIQYKDFALWQRNYLEDGVLERELNYWKNELDGFETLNLKTDKLRPSIIDYSGRDVYFSLDLELSLGLRKLAKDNGITLYSVLLSGFYLLLKSYTGQNDIVIGSPIANRNHVEVSNLIGFFVNTLALREEIDSRMLLIDFIKQIGENVNDAQYYQNLPFEKLVMELGVDEDPSRHPIFQVMFGLQRFGTEKEKESTLFEPYRDDSTTMQVAKFDLTLMLDDSETELKGSFNYAVSLFNAETIEGYILTYQHILTELVRSTNLSIDDLNTVPDSQVMLMEEWNRTDVSYPEDLTMCDMFENQVERAPNALAFVYEDKEYTYRSLDNVANQMAHYLAQELNVKVEDRIAMFLDRTEYMLISMLGILKSGGAYVPIDPNVPHERIEYLLTDVKPKVILTNRVYKDKLIPFGVKVIAVEDIDFESYSKSKYQSGLTPKNLSYIIYTSGTTGRPKGVMIRHTSVVNIVISQCELYGINSETPSKKNIWYANYVFDAHVIEVYTCLFYGHTLHLIAGETRTDIYKLKQYVEDKGIHLGTIPPALLDKDCILPLETLVVAGDVTRAELMELYASNGTNVINAYGPTETTVCSTGHHYKCGDLNTNIGKALANNTLYILDEKLKRVPIGGVGELHIGGIGVAIGYYNNPELSKERFINNPYQSEEDKRKGINSRIYKTGDVVRFLPNGDVDYMGRNDHQVKIRGIRIELGEIENTLIEYPSIIQAAVTVKSIANNKYVAAYYVSNEKLEHSDIENFLSQHLPSFMLPNSYTWLSELPRTVNGKLDMKALPDPEMLDRDTYIPPQTELECKLCEIFAETLAIDNSLVGIEDDFFRLGGNSILAMKLVHRINNVLGKNIRISEIFNNRTVNQLMKLLSEKRNVVEIKPMPLQDPEDQILSFAQERLWFIDQYENGSSAYNIPMVFKLKENTNMDSFISSIHSIIKRHEILRTQISLGKNGNSYQFVGDKQVEINKHKLDSISELNQALSRSVNYIFHLSSEYPIHIELYSVGDEKYVSIVVHHVAFDGWSVDIFIHEILTCYKYHEALRLGDKEEATNYELSDIDIQYKDFALWQRNYLKDETLDTQLAFWKNQLDGYEELNLSTDKVRPLQINYEGDYVYFDIEEYVSENLRQTAQELGISLYSLLLGGFYILLSAYSNQDDIVVGTPSANRNRNEISNLIGFFVNTLALRRKVDGEENVLKFLKDISEFLSLVQNYQELPFEKLVEELHVKKDLSRNPIFQVMFSLQSFGNEQNTERDSLLEIYPLESEVDFHVAKFDLTVMMDDSAKSIKGSFNYQTSLFEEGTIQAYIQTYKNILKQLSEISKDTNQNKKLSELSFLIENDFKEIVFDWNTINLEPASGETLHSSFEKQVNLTPDNIAIVSGNARVTYRELNERSNLLASYLKDRYDIQPDDMVALCLDRSEFIPIAILAVMKSGAAYVPMDTSAPTERLTYMIGDTKAKVVLTVSNHKQKLVDLGFSVGIESIDTNDFLETLKPNYSVDNPITEVRPHNLAYIIYTSGTTGMPKGVMVEHHSVIRLFEAGTKLYNFNDKDVWTLFHSYTFDFSVWELWGALLFGGKLVVPTYEETRSISLFYDLCQSEGLTILNQTPSAFYQFVDAAVTNGNRIEFLRYVIFGGEALNTSQLRPWFEMYEEDKPYLVNMYGITETTVFATYPQPLKKSELDQIPLIGVTMEGYTSYVLDKYKRILPIGAIGELYLGGVGVTRGYLNNPDLTKERFVINPFQTEQEKKDNFNGLLYKSGDLVKLTRKGDLEYIGRNDFQVKIRGFRIELEEISTRLSQMPEVKQSIILVKEHSDDIKYLVAYYISDAPIDSSNIRNYMEQYLPDYMIPSFFMHLSEFPLTLNGKLDRRALPEPSYSVDKEYIAPQNDIQKQLCNLFSDALKIDSEEISIDADFFELGGNSIVATKLIHNINHLLNTKIRIVDLFMNRTVNKISQLIDQSNYRAIVGLNESKSESSMFMVHPGGGGCEAYLSLANRLKDSYKCYGVDSYNMYHEDLIDDLHQLARVYVDQIDKIEIRSSYTLLGWSLGGLIALEIASILEVRGVTDIKVYLLDTIVNDKSRGIQVPMHTDDDIKKIIEKYDGLQFDAAKKLLTAENRITNQSISQKLKHSEVVLFKAMLNNQDRNESNMYYMDSVLQNLNSLEVIKIDDATHDALLDREDILIKRIMNQVTLEEK